MADLRSIVADLADEHADLDAVVAALPSPAWTRPTPAEGWTIADQIGHLAYFDERAVAALRDPDGFRAHVAEVHAAPGAHAEADVERARALAPPELLTWWRDARRHLLRALAGEVPARVPWYGPDMSVASLVSARLMETWAHGQDVVDALGRSRTPTARLRHVCHLGVRALPFSYTNRGLPVPEAPVRAELVAPDGSTWRFGDPAATDVVSGAAVDFALVVTQRRHRDDTTLRAAGPVADQWLSIAQAFAGPPGPGRAPTRPPDDREGTTACD
ncbi:MAG TPA: TIGR03084 family metal-binding protein, partial [Acidimicrobiales bacterium]